VERNACFAACLDVGLGDSDTDAVDEVAVTRLGRVHAAFQAGHRELSVLAESAAPHQSRIDGGPGDGASVLPSCDHARTR
jgi:hypothetical protein